ncbi:MAG: hypothetical protein B6D64_04910 [Bacteroidetes bacterium 4484_276]|nr:MAG: hypothetical protein B6D64_04910 [Bacteroidetes bacterium 4484_276]
MKQKENPEITVFISTRDSTCSECGKNLGKKAWITLTGKKDALCLSCADLDHLLFLQSGDAALTRRSKKYSTLWAVVLKWSRARKRYERQGLLVEEEALELAEKECLADSDVRKRRNERAAIRRTEIDKEYVKEFAQNIHALYPGCPKSRAREIAQHACLKHSGRVGRSSSAKVFSTKAIKLAVMAHIRHTSTDYDVLLSQGHDRLAARFQVKDIVLDVLSIWETPSGEI